MAKDEKTDFRLSLAKFVKDLGHCSDIWKPNQTLPRIQKNFLFVFLPIVQLFAKARATTSKHVKARPDNREQCNKGVTLEYSLHSSFCDLLTVIFTLLFIVTMPSAFDEEYRRDARVFTDALNLLNISMDTSKTDARRAYFKLARVHHPDKGGSTAMFLRVKKAYDHVTNDAIRQWAQRAFDYIDIQAQREALRARNKQRAAERAVRRAQRKRKPDDTFSEIFAQCMEEYDKLNAKRQKTTWQTPDTTAQQRANRNAARTARAARRAANAAHKATKYILDCQRAFRLVLQQRAERANLKT